MAYLNGKPLNTQPVLILQPAQAAERLSEGLTLVCLIRHGQTDWNLSKRLQGRENIPLNNTGHDQAEKLAALVTRMKKDGVNFSAVCTSPLMRAKHTADYISQSLGLSEPAVIEALIERDYGDLSGLTFDERRAKYPKGDKFNVRVETVPVAAKRMLLAVDHMLQVSHGKTVIGVSHGGIINAVFSYLTSGEIGTGRNLSVNCGISLLLAGQGQYVPVAFNLQNGSAVDYMKRLKYKYSNI